MSLLIYLTFVYEDRHIILRTLVQEYVPTRENYSTKYPQKQYQNTSLQEKQFPALSISILTGYSTGNLKKLLLQSVPQACDLCRRA